MGFYCDTSPLQLTFDSVQRTVNLGEVSRSLAQDSRIREYSTPQPNSSSNTSSTTTQPFPHPLNPLEFWREHTTSKQKILQRLLPGQEVRQAIPNWYYWRTEAEIWARLVGACELERQQINDPKYWMEEALFWSRQCQERKFDVTRREIPSVDYWQRELLHWKGKSPLAESDIDVRKHILDVEYWKYEHQYYIEHFSVLLESSGTNDDIDEKAAFFDPLLTAEDRFKSMSSGERPSSPVICTIDNFSGLPPKSQVLVHNVDSSWSVLKHPLLPLDKKRFKSPCHPARVSKLKTGIRRSARIQEKVRLTTQEPTGYSSVISQKVQHPPQKLQSRRTYSLRKPVKENHLPKQVCSGKGAAGRTRVRKLE